MLAQFLQPLLAALLVAYHASSTTDVLSPGCAAGCSGHGACGATHECECEHGWLGEACAERACEGGCDNGGRCMNGTCFCAPGWHGARCHIAGCPKGCRPR